MTSTPDDVRILGTLDTADGDGVVHVEHLIEAHTGDVWGAAPTPCGSKVARQIGSFLTL